MESLYTAIIAGVATIIASVLTIFVKDYLETRKFKNLDANLIEEVNGSWRGEFEQILNEELACFVVDLELKVEKSGRINGIARGTWEGNGFALDLRGGFYSERFLRIDYQNIKKSILQFGAFVLKLDDRGKKLDGCFVGYGHYSGKVISGKAVLIKV